MNILLIGMLAVSAMLQQKCNKESMVAAECFKGRLEVKGMCANYTIALLEGDMDPSKIVASWTDENTGKTYKNVFALGSACSFPDAIQEGQEFYFVLGAADQNCAVCQAFYPKPAKALSIQVLDKPCP